MVRVNIFSPVQTQITANGIQYEINPYTGSDSISFDTEYPFSFEVKAKGFCEEIDITNENAANYLLPYPAREKPIIDIFIQKLISEQKIKACYDRQAAAEFLENIKDDMTGAGYACMQLEYVGQREDIPLIKKCLKSDNAYIKIRAFSAIAQIAEKYNADISDIREEIIADYKKISHIMLYGQLMEDTAIKIGANNVLLTVFSPVEAEVYADGNFIFKVNPYTGFDYKTKSVHYPVKIKVSAKGFNRVFTIDESTINEYIEEDTEGNAKEKRINIFMKNHISREEIVACYDRSRAVSFLKELSENPQKMGGGYACEQLEELGTAEDIYLLSTATKTCSSFVKAKATLAIDKICKRKGLNIAEYAKQMRADYKVGDKKGTAYNYVLKNTISEYVKSSVFLTVFSPVDAVVYSGRTNEKLFEINLYTGLDYGFCYIDYPDDIIIVAKGFEKVFSINEETIEKYKDQIPDESECARISIFLKNFVDESEIIDCFDRQKAVSFLDSIKDSPKSLGASYACRQLEAVGNEEDIELLRIFEEKADTYVRLRARNAIDKINGRQ